MAGSTYGTIFRVSTWGESHGKAMGAVVDGCPSGLALEEADIQAYLDRRRPGQSHYATKRQEADQVEILSGVFEGKTTGTPISLAVKNQDQRSKDYGDLKEVYRPGHGDYGYDMKYGFRDFRGGGRSSGRETLGRVAAGAIALKLLESLGVSVHAYTKSVGDVEVDQARFDLKEAGRNRLCMPDAKAAALAEAYLDQKMREGDSAGGVVECVIQGLPPGVGEPVFDKLDASLAKAILSIGAVKGVEVGDGFAAARSSGSANNDPFIPGEGEKAAKASNHAGGILGGLSDGSQILVRAAFKPTPSISLAQSTVDQAGRERKIQITGRHDPIVVPRAVVAVEAMAALTVADLLLVGMAARLDRIQAFYQIQET